MRLRTLFLVGLVAVPMGSNAQVGRIPPRGGKTPVQPAPLPPEAPGVAKALAYKRSHWTAEAYSLISTVQVPTSSGTSSYTIYGAGTRGDYRFSDRLSTTMDMTVSPMGGSVITETGEVGLRFAPVAWDEEMRGVRPFIDARLGYMHMYDTFQSGLAGAAASASPNQQFVESGRYSRGFGSVVGAGAEMFLTQTLGLTTELSAMRNRLTAYRLTNAAALPTNSRYSMTSIRLAVGLKYNAVRALQFSQNPMR
jgi:hypothetical protein